MDLTPGRHQDRIAGDSTNGLHAGLLTDETVQLNEHAMYVSRAVAGIIIRLVRIVSKTEDPLEYETVSGRRG